MTLSPTIIFATVIAYFILLFILAWITGRNAGNSGFFTGNRSTPWFIATLAMIGAPISGVTFISVPGMVGGSDFSYMQMVLGFMVGYFVLAFLLVPMYYRRNLISIYGYLEQRFGGNTYGVGAWFFFVSKMLGAAVRFFVVCVVLQALAFDAFGIPFAVNVAITVALIWLYTVQGGVKTIVWTDTLKTICLISTIIISVVVIARNMGFDFGQLCSSVTDSPKSRIFFFDNPKEATYFWKQFIAGIFMVIAMTGLDQDMMQRTLACKNARDSQKNMVTSGILQVFVVGMFLVLGVLLYQYATYTHMAMPDKGDQLFGLIAADATMPLIMGIFFIVGLIAASYSAAGSALTSLTTSFTVDILRANVKQSDAQLTATRRMVHVGMAVVMGLVIIVFNSISNDSAINAVYTIASYTYGPILGLFAFGMFTHRKVRDIWVPIVCILAPALSWVLQYTLREAFSYNTGFELLLINAALTIIGLYILSIGKGRIADND